MLLYICFVQKLLWLHTTTQYNISPKDLDREVWANSVDPALLLKNRYHNGNRGSTGFTKDAQVAYWFMDA